MTPKKNTAKIIWKFFSLMICPLPYCIRWALCEHLTLLFSALLTSTLPGEDTQNTDLARVNKRLFQPLDLGQDCALAPANNDIATDYRLFISKQPVTIAMSGPWGDITEKTEDNQPLLVGRVPVSTVPHRSQHFLAGPRDCTLDPAVTTAGQ